LAWRDVSRRSQERRVYAAIIPPNVVTGNSLHVAHFRNNDRERLNVLLAVFNSIPFEFQARANLGTGHVSAGVVRKIRIPDIDSHEFRTQVLFWLTKLEEREPNAEITLEVVVAKAYGLGKDTYSEILDHFDKMPEGTKTQLLEHALWGHDDVALMNVKNA